MSFAVTARSGNASRSQRSRLLLVVLTTVLCAMPAVAANAVKVSLDASKTGAKIDRNIFGQFAEHLGHGIYEGIWVGPDSKIPNTRGIRNDVVTALKALKVPNVRWPGGCFADEYHWRKGIGPASQRAVTLNPNWGGVTEPNTFGSHEFMDFIGQIGSQAYVSVNVGSGTPQDAAEWLEYLTAAQATTLGKERATNGHPSPYFIPYLGIGNESWDCGGNMTPDYYTSQMKIYSRFVRNYNPAQQEKDQMLKIAVGPGGNEPRFVEWTETVMKAYQQHTWSWDINGLSMHSYTVNWTNKYASTGFGEGEYAQVLKDTLEMDGLVKKYSAIMDKYDPEKKVALVVDEWGAWYDVEPGTNPGFLFQQNTMRDAIIAGLNLNLFQAHADRVKMTNIAQMINVLQAMVLTDKEKMLLTPTYHVFEMLQVHQGARRLPVQVNAEDYVLGGERLPSVSASASRDAQGKVHLSLVNTRPSRDEVIRCDLRGFAPKQITGRILTGPAITAHNTFAAPDLVAPAPFEGARIVDGILQIELPAKSVLVLELVPAS